MDGDLVTINNQLNFEIRCIDTKMKKIKLKYKLEKEKSYRLKQKIYDLTEDIEKIKYTHQKQLGILSNRQSDIFNFRSTYFLFFIVITLIVYFFTRIL